MYKSHPHFENLPDDTIIWKYLDLFKYLDLISSSTLFLLRTDKFMDPFEGRGPDQKQIQNIFALSDIPEVPTNVVSGLTRLYELQRQASYVNCWHINDFESSVMWDAYSNSNGGLVIKSTVGSLKDSIVDDKEIYISKVHYNREDIGLQNIMHALTHKKNEFQDERELRVLYLDDNAFNPDIISQEYVDKLEIFQKIAVNTDRLISKVYFHPLTPDWVAASIKAVVAQYGSKFVPEKSSLYTA